MLGTFHHFGSQNKKKMKTIVDLDKKKDVVSSDQSQE